MISNYLENAHPAKHWHLDENGQITCTLCPRNCHIPENKTGFCGVRFNQKNELTTITYGRSVHITEEVIESEAVFHYNPGAKILSVGNFGCMLNCDFCHNWRTSQVKYLDVNNISEYTPQDIVETALSRGIGIISWTYNDPVVWHEFIIEHRFSQVV